MTAHLETTKPKLQDNIPLQRLPKALFLQEVPIEKKEDVSFLLQEQLVHGCKIGDIQKVKAALAVGAKPDYPDASGVEPLGVAVWGMNPELVDHLLAQKWSKPPMSWAACQEHNLRHYDHTFSIPEFAPSNFKDWYVLILRLESLPFLAGIHLQKTAGYDSIDSLRSWVQKKRVGVNGHKGREVAAANAAATEEVFALYRNRIKTSVEQANAIEEFKQELATKADGHNHLVAEEERRAAYTLEWQRKKEKRQCLPALQDALVTACERGDAEKAKDLLEQGALADLPGTKGIEPLGAAVWGMNPEIVCLLKAEMKSVLSMSWEKCEAHNLKHYREVFMFAEFEPHHYKKWHELLLKMDKSPFLRVRHLAEARERGKSRGMKEWNQKTSSWEAFLSFVEKKRQEEEGRRKCGRVVYDAFEFGDLICQGTRYTHWSLLEQVAGSIDEQAVSKIMELNPSVILDKILSQPRPSFGVTEAGN